MKLGRGYIGQKLECRVQGLGRPVARIIQHHSVPREICADLMEQAISAGYRYLDCACDYGNEGQ